MLNTKGKWDLMKITENIANKTAYNRSITDLQNAKAFANFVKTQSTKLIMNKFNHFENYEKSQSHRNDDRDFEINPLNDLRNSSPLNDKIGKFKGRNITLMYEVNLEQICTGNLVNIAVNCEVECGQCGLEKVCFKNCKLCKGDGRLKGTRYTQLSIPAGVKFGDVIKFKAMGEAGLRGAGSGDLYVKFTTCPHEFYVRFQNAIYCRIPISTETLTLGGKINITLPSGNKTTLRLLPSNNYYHETQYTNLGMYEPTGCIKELIVKFDLFSIGMSYIPTTNLFTYLDKFNKNLLKQNLAKKW
ncbi:MAG: DnaJ C-terminal domain-containing protein [Candidatus Hodgkinia cicadicola]